MFLLYISILLVAVSVDGAESLIPVSAPVGSTVVLPCKLTEEFTQTSAIRWHINNNFVLERSINDISADSGFEGRVDVPVDELLKGNCSLVLKDVRITDEGVYKTFWVKDTTNNVKVKEINRVHLSVDAVQISAREGSTVLLPCNWSDPSFQPPHVEWSINGKTVFERNGKVSEGEGYEGRVDVPDDELRKGNCSLMLKNFSVSDAGIYTSSMLVKNTGEHVLVQKIKLSVYSGSDKRTNSSLEDSDPQQPVENMNSWIIPTFVISGIVLIFIFIIIICVFMNRRMKKKRIRIITLATDSIVMDPGTQQRNNTTSDSDYVAVPVEPQS